MDHQAVTIYELSRDPVVSMKNGNISYMNAAARTVFPTGVLGKNAALIIPSHLLMTESESFVSSAFIGKASYTVSVRRHEETVTMLFTPDDPVAAVGSFVNKSVLTSSRSALFNMNMSIDLLRESIPEVSEKVSGYFSKLQHNCLLLTKLVTNLDLAIGLADGSVDFSPVETDLSELCRELCSTSSLLTEGKQAKLVFSSEPAEIVAAVDIQKMRRLLLNIISNSLKNTPPDGTVKVELCVKNSRAIISVTDNGRGIDSETLRHVFAKFSLTPSINTLSVVGEGGLGLCIARGIAQLHSGALLIESKPGRGTVATVMLPLEQSGKLRFKNTSTAVDGSLPLALTYLSDILDSSYYTKPYMD